MRLLYWYTQFLNSDGSQRQYRNLTHFEINLSATDRFKYDSAKNEIICIPLDTPLQSGFWGNKIYNLNVLTGNNGSGKTTIMNYIMDTLYELYCRNLKNYDNTVFIIESEGVRSAVRLSNKAKPTIKVPDEMRIYTFESSSLPAENEILDAIDRTKIIYLANTLNEQDDKRVRDYKFRQHVRQHFIYDCSTSGVIRFNEQDDCSSKETNDLLVTYYFNEHYKQIKYVFDRKQYYNLIELRKDGKPVPVPDSLHIDVRFPYDYFIRNTLPLSSDLMKHSLSKISVSNEMSKTDQITYCLCTGCLYAFEQNLKKILGYNREVNWEYHLDAINYASFEKLFETALINTFPDDKSKKSVKNETQITEIDEAKELLNNCLSFISFVFSEIDKLSDFFNVIDDHNSYMDITSFSVNLLQIMNSDYEWFIEFMSLYRRTCSPYYFLDFSWGLSSGENNLLRMFSSLYYVFDGDDDHIYNWKTKTKELIASDTILLLMDEADLTYHPEWQRQFISILTGFLPKIYGVRKIKDIQVLLTTHSPLLLGDIPKSNVIYLREKEELTDEEKLETFGQNIHQILKNGFFLSNGTVGAFAAEKINATAKKLQDIIDSLKKREGPMDGQEFNVKEEIFNCLQIIDLVAPGILKGKLMALYREAESLLCTNGIEILNKSDLIHAKMMSDEQLKSFIRIYQDELEWRKQND